MVEWWTPSIHHWAGIISTVAFHFALSPPSFRETSELGKRSRMKILVVAVLISQNFCCDAATNWSYISEQFDETWSSYLPSIPDRALNASDYLVADLGSFQTIMLELASLPTDADVDSVFCPVGDNATQWPRDAIRAGPLVDCDADGITCTGGYAGSTCRAANGRANDPSAGSILLMQKLGTYWAKMSAHPAWAMYRFPSVPNARSITVRYELDGRYASELHGGNPCSNATNGDGYQCSLCIDYDGWNFGAPAGFYVLWSASGRSAWAITRPHMPPDMSEEEQDYGILDSPADLELRDDEELVLVFMVYNQYAGVDESTVDGASSCCTCTVGASNNKALMLQTVTIITRGAFSLPQEPRDDDGAVPRLMGADGEYFNATAAPFLDLPCDPASSPGRHGGWPGGTGVVDFKSLWETSALGYAACDGESPLESIRDHWAAAAYLERSATIKTYVRRAALHLLRRQQACQRGIQGTGGVLLQGRSQCQFNSSETAALREAVIAREMGDDWGTEDVGTAFKGIRWWEYTWLGAGGFDLVTSEVVEFFSLFVDTLRPYLNNGNLTAVQEEMSYRMDYFLTIFEGGTWALWNGNNWTPYLCRGAVYWCIVFWHEEPEKAAKVLRAVYDVLWLHRPMYTEEALSSDDGFISTLGAPSVYVEGVSQYSYMSASSMLHIASLVRASFGDVPPAILQSCDRLTGLPQWQLWNLATDARTVPFGDSWDSQGLSLHALHALMAGEVLYNASFQESSPTARRAVMAARLEQDYACEVRLWFASPYWQSYLSPWDFPAELAKNWTGIAAGCAGSSSTTASFSPSRPLGGAGEAVFSVGGYVAMRSPLLPANASQYATDENLQPRPAPAGSSHYEICFALDGASSGDGVNCLPPTAASLSISSHIPYAFLAFDAKSSDFPHSEVRNELVCVMAVNLGPN